MKAKEKHDFSNKGTGPTTEKPTGFELMKPE
jgi:hypothetical protein